jgi:hypothetical protein
MSYKFRYWDVISRTKILIPNDMIKSKYYLLYYLLHKKNYLLILIYTSFLTKYCIYIYILILESYITYKFYNFLLYITLHCIVIFNLIYSINVYDYLYKLGMYGVNLFNTVYFIYFNVQLKNCRH